MRFPLELFAAMRAAWPSDKPMGMRVSATDWMEGGWTPEETVVLARELAKLGCDYLDVSSGGLDPRAKIPLAPGYQVPFSEKVRKETGMPTMTVGLVTDPAQANDIVASGKADMVALGRGVPVAFGILTTDTIEQAVERAGTKAGNKGFEAAVSAIEMASLTNAMKQAGF